MCGNDNGVDIVPMHVNFKEMFASINSTHLTTGHISLMWKNVMEKIVHITQAIPLLFLNANQGWLTFCHCE